MQTAAGIPAKRRQMIADYLIAKRNISIRETAELCGVSEATARRDLDELAAEGFLERRHGGAVIGNGTGYEAVHDEKMLAMMPEKIEIAREALKLIKPGSSIFLDSGTTTLMLAELLYGLEGLTVITNDLEIACRCRLDKSSSLIVTGGMRRDGYGVLAGDIAVEMTERLNVDLCFLGADAVNADKGVFNSNFTEIGIKKAVLKCGRKRVLLCDHSKFVKEAMIKYCDIEDLDLIITDSGIDRKSREALEKRGVSCEFAAAGSGKEVGYAEN